MQHRIYWRKKGEHIHARLFTSQAMLSAQNGLLVFTETEWRSFKDALDFDEEKPSHFKLIEGKD